MKKIALDLDGVVFDSENLFGFRPLLTIAGVKAVAPGRHTTLCPDWITLNTDTHPGSLIEGVPLSVII